MADRIDDLLFAVTQQSNNGVHGLLDAVYGFLQRRTDFYYEAEPNDKMGFPPGVAESMVSSHIVQIYYNQIYYCAIRFTSISKSTKTCIRRGSHQKRRPRRGGIFTKNNRRSLRPKMRSLVRAMTHLQSKSLEFQPHLLKGAHKELKGHRPRRQ